MYAGTYTILMVEDDPVDIQLAMRIMKEKVPALRVILAHSGSEALQMIYPDGDSPDPALLQNLNAILLDLHMPGIDGFEVLQRLKSRAETRSFPVVVLTSSREIKDIERSYKLGANSYVVKPIGMEDFERVVGEIVTYWLKTNETPATHIPVHFPQKRSA